MRDPFPLRPRPTPPVLSVMTWQENGAANGDHRRAVITVQNVYAADDRGKLPAGMKVKWMRIVHVIPQMLICNCCKVDLASFASDSIGRIPLGVVPVAIVAPAGTTFRYRDRNESIRSLDRSA